MAVDGADLVEILGHLTSIAGTSEHACLLADCLERLEPFGVSSHVAAIGPMPAEAGRNAPRHPPDLASDV